jgi:hypothetical protein
MRLLLVLWITIRNAFEAAVWATLFWTASEAFFDVEWIHLFLIFFAILFIGGLGTRGAEPWPMLGIDPMLVGLAIVQATTNALVLAVITIVVASLLHIQTNWLHVFLFFGCACYIPWRRNGKKKAVRAWKGKPKPEWKPSELYKGPSPLDHLPEWQRERLVEHRQKRQHVELGRGTWTRASSDRALVTELDLYWATVVPWVENKIGFICYSKASGQMAQSWYDYDTEKQAMDAAVAWMRHGKSPNRVEDVGTDTATEKQPEADRLQTERDLIEAIDLGARKINKRTADFVPEGEKKSDLLIKMYLEYLCFFVHVTNRLASKVASYKEVDKMYNTLVPLAVAHVLCEVFRSANEAARQEFAKAIPELIEAREKQYAQSKEYASKEWKPLSGTSTVDMLVRNISETLDTHNPEVLFQIQLAARESMQEAKIPELIANYRKAHCAEVPRKIE